MGCGPSGAGGGSCTLGGISTPCGIVTGLIGAGAAEPCPGNDCGPYTGSNGYLYQPILTTEGWSYINPFYSELDPGLPDLNYYDDNPFPNSTGQGSSGTAGVGGCIQRGLAATFGGTVSTGTATQEVGGHWNFAFLLQFDSFQGADSFTAIYNGDFGFPPGARFGPGLHVLKPGPWSYSGGIYAISVTAHLDLFNPNNGIGSILGHVTADFIGGHIVQLFGGNIDRKGCPY